MSGTSSFQVLLSDLRSGDQQTAARVFERYATRLLGLARKKLDPLLSARVDPEDVVQSAFKSFFLRFAAGRFELDSWEGLWALLSVITARKCGRWNEHFHSRKTDVRREVTGGAWEVLSDDPTPLEAASLAETVERLMEPLDEEDREILALRLQGYTVQEVSRRLGCTEYRVRLVHARAARQLGRMAEPAAERA